MSGKFLKIVPPPHPCNRPKIQRETMGIGTLWQCDCGSVWKIAAHYDLQWTLIKEGTRR